MSIPNKIMLITYPNSIGKNLQDLENVLKAYFSEIIYGVHILPFYPSSADRGFAPISYDTVDCEFGTWDNIRSIADNYFLMFDFMINHISKHSQYYRDFIINKNASAYWDFFIKLNNIWENDSDMQRELKLVYKRKPKDPYVIADFLDGSKEKLWCSFGEEQIDINVNSQVSRDFIRENLEKLMYHGASIIRLDAIAYTTKKAGTNCFFVEPDIWNCLNFCKDILVKHDVEILPEIHEESSIQTRVSKNGFWVYDFVLPFLMLYTLYSGDAKKLTNWLDVCPRKQFTVLDTHDGIGVVDVKGVLTDEEISFTQEKFFEIGANIKREYNSVTYNNFDVYQINCTYFSALGNNESAYLLARALQFFTPGIPQIYYVGLFGGKNDIDLIESTKSGRDINRHYYSLEEINEKVKQPFLKRLYRLMKFRNTCPAFNGEINILKAEKKEDIIIQWINGACKATLTANVKSYDFGIKYTNDKGKKQFLNLDL
jgi:sucrose phosphorylase